MVLSLPKTPSWELVKIPLFELKILSLELISTRLLQEANHHQHEKPGMDMVLYSHVQAGKKAHGKSKDSQKTNECHDCHQKGHWANVCQKCEADVKKDVGHLVC